MKKRILILGSTGSIGSQMLQCMRFFEDEFEVVGLTCNTSQSLFQQQIAEWQPRYTLVAGSTVNPSQQLNELIQKDDVDIIVNSLSGSAGVEPTLTAVATGKTVLLANKESLVMRGEEIMKQALLSGANIIPLDSEAAGVWQLLRCDHHHTEKTAVPNICPEKLARVQKIFITASGGPFFGFSREQLFSVTLHDALNHPTWKMGKKITIDSATLMNKAFELIECHHLFGIPPEKIEVLVDCKSMVHAGVEYKDGEKEWVVYPPDMRSPLTDALLFIAAKMVFRNQTEQEARMMFRHQTEQEARKTSEPYIPYLPRVTRDHQGLTFAHLDENVFTAVQVARATISRGQESCAKLCERNEQAVSSFLKGEITFLELLDS